MKELLILIVIWLWGNQMLINKYIYTLILMLVNYFGINWNISEIRKWKCYQKDLKLIS